jgi:hypothetical protein
VWAAYKKKRKAFNNQQRKKRAKLARQVLKGAEDMNPSNYKGCNAEFLCTMEDVEANPLMANHNFSLRDIVYFHVAK